MHHRAFLTISALMLVELTAAFEATMIYAALPTLIRNFLDPSTAGWLVTLHLLVGASSILVTAAMGDRRGRKEVLLTVLAIATVGSLLSAIATEFWIVLIGRAMQGVVGATLPLGIGILRQMLGAEKLPIGVGLIVTGAGMGAAAGLIVGGAIIDNFHWQWLFAASAIMLVISLAAVWLWAPRFPGAAPNRTIDWIDGLLPIGAISALLLAITLSKSAGWASPPVAGLIAAGLMTMIFWTRRNLRLSDPLINLRLLLGHNVAIANIISITMALGTFHIMLVFAPLMQAPTWTGVGLGLTATAAGIAKLPSNIIAFTGGPLAGWITARYRDRATLTLGSLIAFAGWGMTALMPHSLYEIVGLLILISLGTTILMTACLNLAASSVPPASTSEAIASIAVLRAMFMAVGAQMIAVLLSTETITQPGGSARFPAAGAYQNTLGWIAATVVVGFVAILLIKRPANAPSKATLDGAVKPSMPVSSGDL